MPNKIFNVKVYVETDTSPDTSCIGEYTDHFSEWCIVRNTGEYGAIILKRQSLIEKINDRISELEETESDTVPILPENCRKIERMLARRQKVESSGEMELPSRGREYRYFKPYAGGHNEGTPEYKKYGRQDYEHMEGLARGDWSFVGVYAVAEIGIQDGNRSDYTIQKISSSGLWGIESDSGKYIETEIIPDELASLKIQLLSLGFAEAAIDAAITEYKEEGEPTYK
jgi:hypothetical protein